MDERLRDLERQYLRDKTLRHLYAVALNRAGEYTKLHDLVLDQLAEDTIRLDTHFLRANFGGLKLQIDGLKIAHHFRWGTPPPSGSAFLQDAPYYYASEVGSWGVVPHSELAMYIHIAGKPVTRYYLIGTEDGHLRRAVVELGNPQSPGYTGLPSEVLPDEVRRSLGGLGHEQFPSNISCYALAVIPILREERTSYETFRYPIADVHMYYFPTRDQTYFRIPWLGTHLLNRKTLVSAVAGALPSTIYVGPAY